MPLAHNRHIDGLATLTSKIGVPNKAIDVSIRRILRAIAADLMPSYLIDEQD